MVLQIFESFPWMSSRSWECVLQTELHLTITATLEGSIICILHVRDLRIRKMCNKSSWIWHLQMIHICLYCCWVTQSCLIPQSHGVQHTRLPCPPFPGAHSNSCPLSWWCHPTIPFCPLLLLPLIFPSIRVFASESALRIRWPEFWSFSFNISSSHEYSGLISFRMDWLDVLAVQGSLNSLLQHHSSKAAILQHSDFFMVQLSHLCITIGETTALTIWTFVGKYSLLK